MANWKKVIVSGSVAELNSLSLDNALTVPNGGTGAASLTDGGVLLGSGTGAVTALGQATNGQLVIGSTGADPVLATLVGGSGVTINNSAGGIEIVAAGSGGTVTSVTATGTENGITLTADNSSATTPIITLGGALTNVANSQLTSGGTMTIGGQALTLGVNVAEPAFELGAATGLPLTTGIIGVLPTANGGTNLSSYTTGDILFSSATNTLAKLGIGSNGQVLAVSSGGIVEWVDNDQGDITGLTEGAGISITDATGPVPTIAVDYVGADNVILEAQDFAGSAIATTDKIMFSDGSSDVSFANVSDLPFTNNTGDVESVANATNGGIEVTNGGGPDATLAMDINNLAVEVLAAGDHFAFVDESAAGDPTKKATIDKVATLFAGTGLTATNAVIAVDYGTAANTAAEGDTAVTFAGTANEIELSQNTFSKIGQGGAVTIGLPNDVTIGNNLTVANNAVISGDLLVSGTASFVNSSNLDIADKFITLASGSTTRLDGGIIIATGPAAGGTQIGEAFGFNAQAGGRGRWGVTGSQNNGAGAIVNADQMVTAGSSTSAPTLSPTYGGTSGFGNIHVDTNAGDIYIYV